MRGGFRYNPYRRNRWRQLAARTVRPLLLLLLGFTITHFFVLRTYTVPDNALSPQLQRGDVVLVSLVNQEVVSDQIILLFPPYTEPHRISSRLRVLLQRPAASLFGRTPYPAYRHLPVLRRVAAVAGQHVASRDFPDDGHAEPPSGFPLAPDWAGFTVPDDSVAVSSGGGYLDSRHYGPVDLERVRGTVRWRIWPPDRIERLTPGIAP
ncbi:S26 family signal peptidase [Spirochaeta africana]|uniref:Peptidase S26 n=1 Tax=Spirochaeta africana (strain ATCC 700263 / DSM 8902 / Z-7692) TaxID=889378 RepID=H9UJC1_SPIAZ|nr:S26 family signal peptidase [Spirochaeta africana]AFG37614.1 Peptidase S26 [Spirochaeta africana DSM 8902]